MFAVVIYPCPFLIALWRLWSDITESVVTMNMNEEVGDRAAVCIDCSLGQMTGAC